MRLKSKTSIKLIYLAIHNRKDDKDQTEVEAFRQKLKHS